MSEVGLEEFVELELLSRVVAVMEQRDAAEAALIEAVAERDTVRARELRVKMQTLTREALAILEA